MILVDKTTEENSKSNENENTNNGRDRDHVEMTVLGEPRIEGYYRPAFKDLLSGLHWPSSLIYRNNHLKMHFFE